MQDFLGSAIEIDSKATREQYLGKKCYFSNFFKAYLYIGLVANLKSNRFLFLRERDLPVPIKMSRNAPIVMPAMVEGS